MSRESVNDKYIFYKVHQNFHTHHHHHPNHQQPSSQPFSEHRSRRHYLNQEHEEHNHSHLRRTSSSSPTAFLQNSLNCCCIARKMIERNVVTPIVEPNSKQILEQLPKTHFLIINIFCTSIKNFPEKLSMKAVLNCSHLIYDFLIPIQTKPFFLI